ELLKRRGKSHPEVFDESVHAIDTEADRMQQLVNQMLDLAKNKQKSETTLVDIYKLIEKVVHIFQAAYERNISFDQKEKSIYVEGNEEQLEQIIYILLSNALQYSQEEIKLELYQQHDAVYFKVIDQGIGISLENQKRIFDRFYRVDMARTRTSGGTGLGLSIAKSIADAHKGTLTVDSAEGKGSTFTLKLPIKNDSLNSHRILILFTMSYHFG